MPRLIKDIDLSENRVYFVETAKMTDSQILIIVFREKIYEYYTIDTNIKITNKFEHFYI